LGDQAGAGLEGKIQFIADQLSKGKIIPLGGGRKSHQIEVATPVAGDLKPGGLLFSYP
jgi:hypothetical protein